MKKFFRLPFFFLAFPGLRQGRLRQHPAQTVCRKPTARHNAVSRRGSDFLSIVYLTRWIKPVVTFDDTDND
jgi:hypothetical protein